MKQILMAININSDFAILLNLTATGLLLLNSSIARSYIKYIIIVIYLTGNRLCNFINNVKASKETMMQIYVIVYS